MKSMPQLKEITMSYATDNRYYDTLNQPVVMVGNDNESYHVKFNLKNDTRIGINEMVCSLVGQYLELPVFDPIIANVSSEIIKEDDRIQDAYGGKHFATRFIEPFETIDGFTKQGKQLEADLIANVRMVPDFIIFDKYIENFDRHGGNVCLLPNKNLANKMDYYLFDHDLAFQRTPGAYKIANLRKICRKLEHMVFLVSCVTNLRLFDRIINKIVSLGQNIPDIIASIPDAWKIGQTEYINDMEVLLTGFTKQIANKHIALNRDKLSYLVV